MASDVKNVSDLSGGNWYRVWAIHSICKLDEKGNVITAVRPQVVIADDTKARGFSIECNSDAEADARARLWSAQLRQNLYPLHVIVNMGAGELPPDMRAYDEKRMQHYQRTPSLT